MFGERSRPRSRKKQRRKAADSAGDDDGVGGWLDAHLVVAVAEAVVGPGAVDAARESARSGGQFNLLWSLDEYTAAQTETPRRVAAALAAAEAGLAGESGGADVATALRGSPTPPEWGAPGGLSVGGRLVAFAGAALSKRALQAYWLLHHPAAGVEAAFEPQKDAPALIAGIFAGEWRARRLRALARASRMLCAPVDP